MRDYKNWQEVLRAIAKRQDFPKVILRRNGIHIEVPEGKGLKFSMNHIFWKKVYTPSVLLIGRNDIVVDIGAHFGIFTLFAAGKTRNTIYAYEPSPFNFSFLERNLQSSGLRTVQAKNAAVSDRNGSTSFLVYTLNNQGNLLPDCFLPEKLAAYREGANDPWVLEHLLHSSHHEDYEAIEVETLTLPSIMERNNLQHIDFLKMDCEGSEGVILRSTPKDYLQRVRKIAMEFHDHLSPLTHAEIQQLLEEAGFLTQVKWDQQSPVGFLYGWRI
jgi:FkbM family methyltransferase